MKRVFPILLSLVALWPPAARADVTITEESALVDGTEPATMRIYLTGSHVRVDNLAGTEHQAMIFDSGAELFRMVDFARRTYMEMTAAEVQAMAERMQAAMPQLAGIADQIEDQLQGLPEAERQAIEEVLRQQGPGLAAAVPETEYRLLDSDQPVGPWLADHYEGLEGGQRTWELWTIDWSEAGVAESDFAVFDRLAGIMASMAPQAAGPDDLFPLGGDAAGLSGFPVRRIAYFGGEPEARFEITSIEPDPIEPSLFEIPAGFSRQTLPGF